MKFKEIIIKNNNWQSVENTLLKLYPDQMGNISSYKEVFNRLQVLEPAEQDFSIIARWVKDDEETDYVIVSGYYNKPDKNADGVFYSIKLAPWSEWLGMDIDQNTLKTFSELEIIAHCLYEMTFWGFDEDTIQEALKEYKDSKK
ncbi:MAG: hypothetical protein GX259_00025 [Bacteroidales bacterium]|jgi:hypothetical protein|nr:hypothetical protein [Bacteroidales bacterium]